MTTLLETVRAIQARREHEHRHLVFEGWLRARGLLGDTQQEPCTWHAWRDRGAQEEP